VCSLLIFSSPLLLFMYVLKFLSKKNVWNYKHIGLKKNTNVISVCTSCSADSNVEVVWPDVIIRVRIPTLLYVYEFLMTLLFCLFVKKNVIFVVEYLDKIMNGFLLFIGLIIKLTLFNEQRL